MQRAWRDDPKYKDTEFVVYHYPMPYFDRIRGGERFVYYRPSRGAAQGQASSYFGCGELGDVWDDPFDSEHRYVGIRKPLRFSKPVPFADTLGRLYESRFRTRSSFQGQSVRFIDDLDFHRILDAAGLTGAAFFNAPTIDDVMAGRASPMLTPPLDVFRALDNVPEGTGYKPHGAGADVYEAAALQERARADHQNTVRLIKRRVDALGGSCLFNNNVDLLAQFDRKKLLIEVKSLNSPTSAVDRMRYGMGQLFDYSVRYRARIGNAAPVLAFGATPRSDVAWVADILHGNDVAFISRDGEQLRPMNDLATQLPLFR